MGETTAFTGEPATFASTRAAFLRGLILSKDSSSLLVAESLSLLAVLSRSGREKDNDARGNETSEMVDKKGVSW